jgi:RNA recognition motif-containing protein
MTQFEKNSANFYNTTVFVGGIPGSISHRELSAYFTQFGKINCIELPIKKTTESVNSGYCYVTFASQSSKYAVLRIRDHLIGSRRVTCKHYLNGSHLSAEIQSSNERKLFVKFIPGWVTENDFKAYFEQFGKLESYYMVKYRDPSTPENKSSSSVGYLVYQDRAISDRILAQRVFKIGNKKMQVSKYDRNYTRIPNNEVDLPQKPQDVFPYQVNHYFKPTQVMYSQIRQTKSQKLQASSSSTSLEKILPDRDHEVNYRFNHLVQYRKHPFSRQAGFASSIQPRNCPSELRISPVKEDMVLSASLSDAPTLRHSSGMSLGTTPTNTAARNTRKEAKVGPCQ